LTSLENHRGICPIIILPLLHRKLQTQTLGPNFLQPIFHGYLTHQNSFVSVCFTPPCHFRQTARVSCCLPQPLRAEETISLPQSFFALLALEEYYRTFLVCSQPSRPGRVLLEMRRLEPVSVYNSQKHGMFVWEWRCCMSLIPRRDFGGPCRGHHRQRITLP
jgi:hypothetical protein